MSDVKKIATRQAYGEALAELGEKYPNLVVMDADLPDPPELVPEMYRAVKEEGYDCAATRRIDRKGEPIIRSAFARAFYRNMNKMAKLNMMDGARDYRFMKRVMVDAILSMKEYHRFSKGIFGWVGFQTKWIDFENRERVAGKTKWSFFSLFRYSLEGMVAFSTAPLEWASFVGLFFCFVALVLFICCRDTAWHIRLWRRAVRLFPAVYNCRMPHVLTLVYLPSS